MAETETEVIDVEVQEITEIRQLSPGDQIAVNGEMQGVKYFHHGIYVGENVGVIHFGGENKPDVKIKDDDIKVFWGSKRLIKITYPNVEDKDPEEVIWTAKWLKDNPARWDKFDLIDNNCEHFATHCKIGKAVSTQVDEKINMLIENPKPMAVVVSAGSSLAAAHSLLN